MAAITIVSDSQEVNLQLKRGDDHTFPIRLEMPGRNITDLVVTQGETGATSATADFTADDEGSLLVSPRFPEGTTITTVTNATTIVTSEEALDDDTAAGAVIHTRSVVDLTGCTGAAQVRLNPNADDVVAEFTVGIDSAADEGWLTLTMTHEESAKLPTRGTWDLQITDADGKIRTYIGGSCTGTRDTTRIEVP